MGRELTLIKGRHLQFYASDFLTDPSRKYVHLIGPDETVEDVRGREVVWESDVPEDYHLDFYEYREGTDYLRIEWCVPDPYYGYPCLVETLDPYWDVMHPDYYRVHSKVSEFNWGRQLVDAADYFTRVALGRILTGPAIGEILEGAASSVPERLANVRVSKRGGELTELFHRRALLRLRHVIPVLVNHKTAGRVRCDLVTTLAYTQDALEMTCEVTDGSGRLAPSGFSWRKLVEEYRYASLTEGDLRDVIRYCMISALRQFCRA